MSGHVVERLSPFLDGELPEAERREVQSHLEGCADCAAHLADLAAVDAEARGLGVEAPTGYFEGLPGRVRLRLRPRRPRALPVWGWAAAAAVLIAVLVPRLAYQPSVQRQAPTAVAPAAPPPPTSVAPARELAPEPAVGRLATPPPAAVLEQVRPSTKRDPAAEGARAATGGSLPAPAETGRTDAPRPGGTLARDEAKTEAFRQPSQSLGYAAPPAAAALPETPAPPPPPPPAPEEREAFQAEPQKAQKPSAPEPSGAPAAGALSKARRKQAFEDDKGAAETKEKDADTLAPAPRSVLEARAQREKARERAGRHPEGAAGDAARLELVEAGARAYELGRDPRDLEILKKDAAAYLERRDARHPERVRERLRSVEGRP